MAKCSYCGKTDKNVPDNFHVCPGCAEKHYAPDISIVGQWAGFIGWVASDIAKALFYK